LAAAIRAGHGRYSNNGQTQLSPGRPCFSHEACSRRFPPAVFGSFTGLVKSILMIPFNKH